MTFDWSRFLWQGRWDGLLLLFNVVVLDARTIWWFGPLVVLLFFFAGRKVIARLIAYVANVFVHSHSSS